MEEGKLYNLRLAEGMLEGLLWGGECTLIGPFLCKIGVGCDISDIRSVNLPKEGSINKPQIKIEQTTPTVFVASTLSITTHITREEDPKDTALFASRLFAKHPDIPWR